MGGNTHKCTFPILPFSVRFQYCCRAAAARAGPSRERRLGTQPALGVRRLKRPAGPRIAGFRILRPDRCAGPSSYSTSHRSIADKASTDVCQRIHGANRVQNPPQFAPSLWPHMSKACVMTVESLHPACDMGAAVAANVDEAWSKTARQEPSLVSNSQFAQVMSCGDLGCAAMRPPLHVPVPRRRGRNGSHTFCSQDELTSSLLSPTSVLQ
jgi:hypothetical protein